MLLFTEKWLECVPYLQILSAGLTIGVLGVIPLQALKAIGRSDIVLRLEFIKKPVYVLLLIVGVYRGTMAIAITMALYDLYGTIVNVFQLKRHLDYDIHTQLLDILPSIGCALAMAAAIYFIPLPIPIVLVRLIVKAALGFAIYVGLSKLLGIESYKYLVRSVTQKLAERRGQAQGQS